MNLPRARPINTSQRRLAWIEWVRGFAAAMVVMAHFLAGVLPEFDLFSRSVIDMGRVGVVAFFLVSGFVVPLSYRRQSTSVFIIRRVTRLYPVYLLVLAVTVAVYFPNADWTSPLWWAQLALNATMLQQLFGSTLVTVAWTLAIELVFYGQQIFFKQIGKLDTSWKLGYFWTAIFLVMIAGEHVLKRDLPISFPMLLAVACMGHALSLAHGGILGRKQCTVSVAVITLGLTLGSLTRANVDPLWPALLYTTSLIGGLAFFGIAYLLRNRFELRWAIWLGSISYSLYLTHSVTGVFIQRASRDMLFPAFAASLILAVATAWLLHRFLELPFIRLGRTFRSASASVER